MNMAVSFRVVKNMVEEEKREEGKVSLRVLTREKDAQTIQDSIREAERELDVSSHANVEELPRTRFIPGISVFLVVVGTAFATRFAEKFGESFADWLARKLGLDESKGEEVSESG